MDEVLFKLYSAQRWQSAAAVCRDKKVMNHLTQPSSHVFFFSGEKGKRKAVAETRPVLCGPQEEVG